MIHAVFFTCSVHEQRWPLLWIRVLKPEWAASYFGKDIEKRDFALREVLDKTGSGKLSRYSDSLGAGRSGDRITAKAKFSAPVQTGPGAHPASYAMDTGSFPGVKRPGRGVDHPPLHLAPRLKKE